MLAEQSGQALDAAVLDGFGLDDIDQATLKQYRQLWSSRDPGHPWLADEDRPFLGNIGAYRVDRQTGHEGLTIAGLLMFGLNRAILDPDGVPAFGVDYRERVSNDVADRWTDRVTYDGKWECNLLQFLQRVLPRLTADIKTPFRLNENLVRIDDTEVHQAVREALVNALVHADYAGQGGIVVEKFRDRLEFANPGTLLISKEQVLRGGVSECRNTGLQRMLGFLGYGERAGSGFSKILRGWRSQNWRSPDIEETIGPDRVRVVLPMVSLVPDDSLRRLRDMFGAQMDELDADEVQALVTADVEWRVSNSRMQRVSSRHPADLTKMLQGLVARGMLEQVGQKRGTRYRLPGSPSVRPISPPRSADASEQSAGASAPTGAGDSVDIGAPATVAADPDAESALIGVDSHQIGENSYHSATGVADWVRDLPPSLLDLGHDELRRLADTADPIRAEKRIAPDRARAAVCSLCDGRYLTAAEIGALMGRNAHNLRARLLTPMVRDGLLAYRFPDQPNRPDQAYTTAKR